MSARSGLVAALAAALALSASTGAARAQCVYTPLVSGTAQATAGTSSYFSFAQTFAYWTAVAVRPPAGEDWDMAVYSGTAAYPGCVSGPLAGSSQGVGITDFVVGDFNGNLSGTYYVDAYRFSGAGNASVEWEDGPDLVNVGTGTITASTGATDLVRVWDVYLGAGATYEFSLSHTGSADIKMFLFRNPGGVYWSGRSSAVLQIAGAGCATYTAPSSGYYGLVVVNDDGGADTYTLGVSSAPCGCPSALVSQATIGEPPTDHVHSFTQTLPYWAAVVVQASSDWDIQLASNASGNASPTCVGNILATSGLAAGVADFVIVDFNNSPLGTYYTHTHQFNGSAPASTEWYGGAQLMHLNDALYFRTQAPGDLIQCWDVYLEAGHTYHLQFVDLQAHLKAFLFRNPGSGAYYAGRFDAAVDLGGFFDADYVAPSTGYYGLVVVDDTGLGGNFALRVEGCTPPVALADKTPVNATHGDDYWSFSAAAQRWGVVGVKYETQQRAIGAYSLPTGGPVPQCLGGGLALSAAQGDDFVVGDFHHDPLGTYYARTTMTDQSPAAPAHVKWDSGDGTMVVNDNNLTVHSEDMSDWLHVYDVDLQGSVGYRLDMTLSPSVIGPAVYFYENPGSAPYWGARDDKVAEVSGNPNFSVPKSGTHAAVVFDWNGLGAVYSMRIVGCPPTRALTSAVPDPVQAMGFYRIDQASPYWMAVGVRSTGSDWDIEADHDSSGSGYGICFANPITSSTGVGWVDYVVGDFNAGGNPYGTYYIRPYRFSGSSPGLAEWDGGTEQVFVGAPWTHRVLGPNQVLECWDVYLQQGQSYDLYLKADPGVDAKLDLFRSNNAPYWAPRSARVYEGTTTGTFVAPASDFYGLVLVNDNGGSGNVDLGVYLTGTVAVNDGGPAPATTLTAISPNPGRGALRIQYALHDGAPVSFDVLDVSGRVVSHLDEGQQAAGRWSVEWPGTGDGGRHLPAGLYFVRMSAGSRQVATRRVTLLN